MVRAAVRPLAENTALPQLPRDRVDFCYLQRLLKCEIRQNRGKRPGKHGFSRARRPDQQRVVSSRGGNLHRPLGVLLPLNLAEIHALSPALLFAKLGRPRKFR